MFDTSRFKLRVEMGRDVAVCWLWCKDCNTGVGTFTQDNLNDLIAEAEKHHVAKHGEDTE